MVWKRRVYDFGTDFLIVQGPDENNRFMVTLVSKKKSIEVETSFLDYESWKNFILMEYKELGDDKDERKS